MDEQKDLSLGNGPVEEAQPSSAENGAPLEAAASEREPDALPENRIPEEGGGQDRADMGTVLNAADLAAETVPEATETIQEPDKQGEPVRQEETPDTQGSFVAETDNTPPVNGYGFGSAPGAQPQTPYAPGVENTSPVNGFGFGTAPGAQAQPPYTPETENVPPVNGYGFGTAPGAQAQPPYTPETENVPPVNGFGAVPDEEQVPHTPEAENAPPANGFGTAPGAQGPVRQTYVPYGQGNGSVPPPPPYGGTAYGAMTPRGPRQRMSAQSKVILGVFLGLAFVFIMILVGSAAYYITAAPRSGSSQTEGTHSRPERPAESGSLNNSTNLNPYYESGDNGNPIAIEPKSGAPMTPEEIFTKVSPSVVGVIAEGTDSTGSFGESQGTGIIASSDGIILTNSHVVLNSRQTTVKVVLQDKTEYEAVVKGYDQTSDLAVLKISAEGLPAATFGNADEMKVGEAVYVIGNPGGIQYASSMTDGMVSALRRPISNHSENGMTYIQTNAAINPGNSGGPLLNAYGQVIGITSNKIMATGVEGMGFAIPLNQAEPIINGLITTGYVGGRGRLGITVRNLQEWESYSYGYSSAVCLQTIQLESPLMGTEAEEGDLIVEFEGQEVTSTSQLTGMITQHKAGEKVSMTLYSVEDDEEYTVEVELLEDKGETQN